MEFIGIIMMAIIVEGLITYVKEFFVNGKFQWQMLASIAIGVFCATVYHVDLFQMMGMQAMLPYAGCVLTGVLISRGSNYIFDLIKKIQNAGSEA